MYMYASYLMLFRFLFPHAQIYTHWYQCTICILLRSSLPFQTFGMHVIQCSRNELNTAYMYITFSASCFKKFAISLKINKKERIYILANWYQYCLIFSMLFHIAHWMSNILKLFISTKNQYFWVALQEILYWHISWWWWCRITSRFASVFSTLKTR